MIQFRGIFSSKANKKANVVTKRRNGLSLFPRLGLEKERLNRRRIVP